MRFLKRNQLNSRNVKDNRVSVEASGEVKMFTAKSLRLPKGVTSDRPLTPEAGHVRYNTSTNELEAYQNSAWRKVAFKEPTAITVQTLGVGDEIEVYFGPLNSGNTDYPVPALTEPQNIMVYVENVYQLPVTNYTLEDNPSGKTAGRYVKFDSEVPLGKPVTVLHGFDR